MPPIQLFLRIKRCLCTRVITVLYITMEIIMCHNYYIVMSIRHSFWWARIRSLGTHIRMVGVITSVFLKSPSSSSSSLISNHWQKSQVGWCFRICTADWQADEGQNQLSNNLKIDEPETFASHCSYQSILPFSLPTSHRSIIIILWHTISKWKTKSLQLQNATRAPGMGNPRRQNLWSFDMFTINNEYNLSSSSLHRKG